MKLSSFMIVHRSIPASEPQDRLRHAPALGGGRICRLAGQVKGQERPRKKPGKIVPLAQQLVLPEFGATG